MIKIPYINATDGRREALRNGDTALTAGELNYQIFFYVKHNTIKTFEKEVIKGFVVQFLGEKPNYERYNAMTGALIRCYVEIKRRLNIEADYLVDLCANYNDEIASYEDLKIQENSDVE